MQDPVWSYPTVTPDRSGKIPSTEAEKAQPTPSTNANQEWTPRRVAAATLTAIGVAFGFFLLYRFYMVVFIFFVAYTLQIALRPGVEWLSRRGLHPKLGMALLYILLLGVISGLLWLAAPMLVQQATSIWQEIPEYYHTTRNSLFQSDNRLLRAVAVMLPLQPTLPGLGGTTESSALGVIEPVWQSIRSISYVTFITIAVLILAFYWMLEGELVTRRAVLLAPMNQRDELRTLLTEIEIKVGAYFRGQVMLCFIVGIGSIIAYFLIGLPYALGLGLIMFVFEALPVIGPTLGAVPALVVALTVGPDMVIWTLVVVLVIQGVENNLLVPRIMDQSVGVNAIVSLLAIAAFGILFGIGGAILAIPLAAILQIVLNRLLFNVPVSEEAPTLSPSTDHLERNQVSVLRFETQHLVQDVRKQVRATDSTLVDPETERVEDMIEAIATDLDSILSKMETEK